MTLGRLNLDRKFFPQIPARTLRKWKSARSASVFANGPHVPMQVWPDSKWISLSYERMDNINFSRRGKIISDVRNIKSDVFP